MLPLEWQFLRLNVHYLCYLFAQLVACFTSMYFNFRAYKRHSVAFLSPSCRLIHTALIAHDSELWQIYFLQLSAICLDLPFDVLQIRAHHHPPNILCSLPPPPRKCHLMTNHHFFKQWWWRCCSGNSHPGQHTPAATWEMTMIETKASGVCRLEGRDKCWWWGA